MSFELAILELESIKSYPQSIILQKKKKIQETFPREYAEYERKEDMTQIGEKLIKSATSLSNLFVFPSGIRVTNLTIEYCSEKGEIYKESQWNELGKLMIESMEKCITEFHSKYPMEFQDFIQKEHPLHERYGNQVTAYFQGILSRIRKDYLVKKTKPKKVKATADTATLLVSSPATATTIATVTSPEASEHEKKTRAKKVKPVTESSTEKSEPVKEPKKKAVSSTMKKLVWNKNNGEEVGKAKCYSCKSTDITQTSFHCGHIIAESKGGKTIVSNLKPICQNCNSSMGTMDMNEFMKTLE